MNHTSDLRPYPASSGQRLSGLARKGLLFAVPPLLVLGGTGCFRASGLHRDTVIAEAIPETGGDRVYGLKSTAGPGDYYIGNDFIQIAIDGTHFGDTTQTPIAGAASGGSIVDAGYLGLDTSYQRVNMPADSLDRLTPVVNQDPTQQIVFTGFEAASGVTPVSITMTGKVLDPNHRIANASWDSDGCVQGVTVVHTITLGKQDRFFILKTVITNDSGSILGIRSIGDNLVQTLGGYRLAIPAGLSISGEALDTPWGVEIPGCDFGSPIATAVQAPMVAFMATEPSSDTLDSHASLGLMSEDAPMVMVTSDPQSVYTQVRPAAPEKVVVGSLPTTGLSAGDTLSYTRRMYILGGPSTSSSAPHQSTYLFNLITAAKFNSSDGFWPQDIGQIYFSMVGSALRRGPMPTDVRLERNVGAEGTELWVPERTEWLEPGENMDSSSGFGTSSGSGLLPVGTYRIVVNNRLGSLTLSSAVNSDNSDNTLQRVPIVIKPSSTFSVGSSDYLCPEVAELLSASGTMVRSKYGTHTFSTRERNAPASSPQPLRIVIKGTNGTSDPWMKRSRNESSLYSSTLKAVSDAANASPAQYQIRAGNEMFGTGFHSYTETQYFWLENGTVTDKTTEEGIPVVTGGTFRAYGIRGPLSYLQYLDILAYNGQYNTSHPFIVWPRALPTGWTSFDVPGPSQATSGGMLPGEKLTSAMAEGVQVVAHTELDQATNAKDLYNNYRAEFNSAGYLETQLTAVKNDPYVVAARTSELTGFGAVTALFTPDATSYRFGGAVQPKSWTLSDFITQSYGSFTVVHRPRGPKGLFTLAGFDGSTDLGTGTNAWWDATGAYSNGVTNGAFDAIELLRGEGFDGTAPDSWFQEFLQVRSDWFALLNKQTREKFTKALGLSSAKFTFDTPVGLARTYLKATPVLTNPPTATVTPEVALEQDLSTVLSALKSGAAVVSTGPFLDVKIGTTGPGGLVAGPQTQVTLSVDLYKSDWMPVDEIRIVMNGSVIRTILPSTLAQSADDSMLSSGSYAIDLPATGKGAWIVVEAGVPLTQTGVYQSGSEWNTLMRGIYPIAVTNPIFIDVAGTGYTHP